MSTPLLLAQVTDPDCVVSFSPLVLDWPDPYREVSGVPAVLRRATLYRWITLIGSLPDDQTVGVSVPLFSLAARRMSPRDLAVFAQEYEGQSAAEDFVSSARVTFELSASGALSIPTAIQLVDGRVYQFELTLAADVGAAITTLGSF